MRSRPGWCAANQVAGRRCRRMTAQWEGARLLEPVTADAPCGENLEDTPLLASFDTFRLFGQPMPLDPQPQWSEIRNRAAETLARSKDLRLLAYLGTALLRTDGLAAFSETLTIAADWLETYWSGVYPLVDEDAILRRNALNCFADPMAVVDAVRRVALVRSRQHGTFSLRDLEIAAGQAQPADGETPAEEAHIDAAFGEVPVEDLQSLQQRVEGGLGAISRIDAVMAAAAGADAVPTFDQLAAQLVKADRALRGQIALRVPEAAADGDPDAAGAGQAMAVGAIRSRQDAIRALDAVAMFFRNNEPSSPVPLFVDRAKRLVSKDFLEVLADIAPEGLPQARSAGGLPQNESHGE